MTTRDRIVITVVAAAALLAGYWFLILAPKRDEAQKLDAQVSAAKQRRNAAVADAAVSRAAQSQYAANYATVARLGKAVPANEDVPSLVYQLSATSTANQVDFREIKLTSGGGATPPAPTPSAPSGSSQGKSGSSGSTGASGSTTTAAASTATATQSTTASLPPGAIVGPAGLPTMPFSFTFEGSFFHLSDFFGSLNDLVGVQKTAVDVRGRLLMIDGIALGASPQGFPHMKAQVAATAFMVPPDEGTTNGATPSGPAAAASTKSVSGSGSSAATPPAATAGSAP